MVVQWQASRLVRMQTLSKRGLAYIGFYKLEPSLLKLVIN